MSIPQAEASEIAPLGWRQGSVLPPQMVERLQDEGLLPKTNSGEGYIVIGQDCDVVHQSFVVEPGCEVIHYKPVAKKDGNLVGGKSARKIHFQFEDGTWAECSIRGKCEIPRGFLAEMPPSSAPNLSELTVAMLKIWLAKRYSRKSFPDEFNRRYWAVKDDVKDEFRTTGHLFEDIYIQTCFDELEQGIEYEVVIIGAMWDEIYDDDNEYELAEQALERVGGLLEQCEGIKAIQTTPRPRSKISLLDLDSMRAWDYLDSLSISS